MRVGDLETPALVVDHQAFAANVEAMGARWPAASLRPHVKAFKSTELARALAGRGHLAFSAATAAEIEGMAIAGLGSDLLLANQLLSPIRLRRLGRLVADGQARVTVAVDSEETIAAAAAGGLHEVLIDVAVGMPRCGCDPADAERLADLARQQDLRVRGVMGYEGHLVGLEDRAVRETGTEESMQLLARAHDAVGGDVVSGGGTGTWDINQWVTELQAGSFTLMDTAYEKLDLPFRPALGVLGTVLSTNPSGGWAVADVGLKALGLDHGNPSITGCRVWFCSDEHVTFGAPKEGAEGPSPWPAAVDDRALVWPAHVDPTVAKHRQMHVIDAPLLTDDGGANLDAEVVQVWPVDLRDW